MRTTSWMVAVGLLISGSAQLVPRTIMMGTATTQSGHVQFETRLEPSGDASQTRRITGGVAVSDSTFHRYLKDGATRTYYGYDVSLERIDEGAALRVSILPLSFDAERLELPDPETWTSLSPPQYPEPQTVRLGDTMAFDLFVNPATRQKIVEYLHFGERHRRETAMGPAREFTIHDARLEIRAGRLTINGEEIEEASMGDGSVRGHFVVFYLPPKGRFVLSLVPHPEVGLSKAGEVRGSTLRFRLADDTYEINSEGKIAPGGAAYDLFVFHDPTYRPDGDPDARFFYGSSGAFQGTR